MQMDKLILDEFKELRSKLENQNVDPRLLDLLDICADMLVNGSILLDEEIKQEA